nr:TaqI-like C-terminal specificity domain-containing protein [Methanobrevibacter sp.]
MKLTISKLIEEARAFCKNESAINHEQLVGITDGKAVGTYIEHRFKEYLKNKYEVTIGSSAKGVDLPDDNINTDIKVTSATKPQSSSPFKNFEQQIYGLGYNLLIFVYKKNDINEKCYLGFKHCIFLESEKSGDYGLTKVLRKMIELGANETDIIEILKDKNFPKDYQSLKTLAKKIMSNPPKQGYLTISNAFQWRLQYNQIIKLKDEIDGVYTNTNYNEKELEDYQTPLSITEEICAYLKNNLKINPTVIIEPTCGIGNFLRSASKVFDSKELYGIEIDAEKINAVDRSIPNLNLINEDIFKFKFDMINENESYLIIGNPPQKNNTNFINNLQGKTNCFNMSEQIILKIIEIFKNTKTTIAFLCKTTVARNIFKRLIKNKIPYNFVKQLTFNFSKISKMNKNSCLLIIQLGEKQLPNNICEVSEFSNPDKILHKICFEYDSNSNNDKLIDIDGKCEIDWKLGVKHDCAKIMELTCKNNQLMNNLDEKVNIETILLYPLLKGGDLKKPLINETSKYIIITQKKIKQDTTYIKTKAPKTWEYLNNNKTYFDNRKSKMYKRTPAFSISDIGDYAFKKYKVGISGFNKEPNFTLVYNEKPVMLDNSCYYLSFDDFDEAYITLLILNSQLVKKFLKNIAFLDSKRPFSKVILKRINIGKCLKILSFADLKKIEKELNLNDYIMPKKFLKYKNKYCETND